uniref:Uncharacterized protein AlNc14C118G6592 n=1 Tax=Albugo laibachii Nc14 TaxID=890382 RepID=F0WJ61_9STRA|nr:conserved hypothetical protein [Albugo laibachii Nc14]|eukprot:CCA21307.1 conserved hypothetical protein [Albugo laibachii Nc14]
MLKHSESDIIESHERYPDYSLLFTGHSLGAGLAALASIDLHSKSSEILREKLQCIGFATPACITLELARACRSFVTTIIHGDDCIPRLHQQSLLRLQELVSSFDWRTSLKQMIVEELEGQKNRAHARFTSRMTEQTQLARKTREGIQKIRDRRDESFHHLNHVMKRLEDLKLDEKRVKASAKVAEVGKKIGEQVRDQFSEKWYAALEYLNMDQLDLHKVEELKNSLLVKYGWSAALASTEAKVKQLTDKVVITGTDLQTHVTPQLGHWYNQMTRLYDITLGKLGQSDPNLSPSTQASSSPLKGEGANFQYDETFRRTQTKMQVGLESGMKMNKIHPNEDQEWSEEPLVSPGRVLYLRQNDGTEDTTDTPILEPADNESFNEVILSDNMIKDHLCTTYEEVLQALQAQLERQHPKNG